MMNGKNAHIVVATECTLPTKLFDQGSLATPIAALLLKAVSVAVPVLFLAIRRTETRFARPSALATATVMRPAAVEVARRRAKLGFARLGRIERLVALRADFVCACFGAARRQSRKSLVPSDAATGGTRSRAVFPRRSPLKGLLTMRADMLHVSPLAVSIARLWAMYKSGYFEIAQKRIAEAQMQPVLGL